jgi:hypothetical protein
MVCASANKTAQEKIPATSNLFSIVKWFGTKIGKKGGSSRLSVGRRPVNSPESFNNNKSFQKSSTSRAFY